MIWDAAGGSAITIGIVLLGVGGLGYVLRTWIGAVIGGLVAHNLNLRLEEQKDELRRLTEQLNSVQSATNAALVTGQSAIQNRRIGAAAELWEEALRLKNEAHPVLGMLDTLYEREYQRFVEHPRLKAMVPHIEEAISDSRPEVDRVELFLDGDTFMTFFIYRALLGRILFLLSTDVEKGEVRPWYNDERIQRQLSALLSDDELKMFHTLELGRIRWLREIVEGRILSSLRDSVSGKQMASAVLSDAQKIRTEIQSTEAELDRHRLGNVGVGRAD